MTEFLLAYSMYTMAAGAMNDDSILPQIMPFADHYKTWFVIGVIGQTAFMSRFLLQWIESEKKGESVITPIFWWQSLFGSLILLAYFLKQREIIGVAGFAVNIIPYSRNLVLIYRKERLAEEGRVAAAAIKPPAND